MALAIHQHATVIPIYCGTLTVAEERRLRRTLENSPSNSCFLVGPNSLQKFLQHELLTGIPFVGFPDEHFESVRTYSRWMLLPDLYREFNAFKFVVVCQLDAVIVQPLPLDLDFGFDYLGSPWIPPWHVSWNPIVGRLKLVQPILRPLARTLRVGNGGLSIRRVNVFRRLSKLPRFSRMANEDIVISYFHRRLGIVLAPPELAAQFFMESGAGTWTEAQPIPSVYGFHALEKFNPALEEAIFSHTG